ncbi:alpha/beta fold hydrolase [Flavobacterium soyangense]|uniref:Alpha/beta hydrolase n=1 Tax=Flavobacterium soyangense TaxID=2023265 RepID=A0A930XX62_9FLAO|nr:alpha/beta hydrolase [Flavobacterium soyangense]MBF2709907.1 alpha/beta hydrolase [Flavobacterium soyangense]
MIVQKQLTLDHLTFDLRCAGDSSNELVILLHGFPETNHMWIPLMEDLVKKDFYCVAPNLRGYSPSAQPKGKKNYTLEKLAADVVNISKAFGKEKIHLIGHDWGACIGWYIAYQHPELVLSWSALSIPHLQGFGEALAKDATQKKMSAYMQRFQIPWLPEYKIKKDNFALLKLLWKNCTKDEIADYLSVLKKKGTVTAALNYYRENYKLLKSGDTTTILGNVDVPTLLIWGEDDFAIGSYSVEKCKDYLTGAYTFVKVKGGHWLVQTNYNEVASAIGNHLDKYRSSLK